MRHRAITAIQAAIGATVPNNTARSRQGFLTRLTAVPPCAALCRLVRVDPGRLHPRRAVAPLAGRIRDCHRLKAWTPLALGRRYDSGVLMAGQLWRRPGRRPSAAVAAECLCAAAVVVVLAGCSGGPAGEQASTGRSTPAAGSSRVATGTWQAEDSGTRQRLYDVACLSALRCEAVGAAGTIVATADGGRTWQAQANPLGGSSQTLNAIACVASGSCYVSARPDTILVTHDGGATWSQHVLPVGVSGTELTDQACLIAYTPAMIGRYALCRLGLLDIACVSAGVCYAVATASPAYDDHPVPTTPDAAPSSIWMTRDGGASWARQSVPPGVTCNGDCPAGLLYPYSLEWVTCLSSGLCRAGGGHFVGSHLGFADAVLVTRGPGQPWACTTSAAACPGVPDVADCPAATRCYGVKSTNPFDESFISVLRSADGGAGWQLVGPGLGWSGSVPNDIACPAAPTPTARDLYGIGCAGPATCYAVGDNGTILALQ